MEYEYLKSRALNQKEKKRLRLSVTLGRRLRAVADENAVERLTDPPGRTQSGNRNKRSNDLLRELLCLFSNPTANASNAVIDWALCYLSPGTLRRLIYALADRRPQNGTLDLIKHGDPCLLLPREHITPDFQRSQRSSARPDTALVCFTGNAHRLNIPVQLFHILAVRTFDLIVYLRDDKKQRFIDGIPGLGADLEGLGVTLRGIIPGGCHTAILSASSGGLAASRIAGALNADRIALFSPEYSFKNITAINDGEKTNPENTRLFFARNNPGDARLAEYWGQSHLSDSIRWLETSTHGTLTHLVRSNNFQALAEWLAGRDKSRQEQ